MAKGRAGSIGTMPSTRRHCLFVASTLLVLAAMVYLPPGHRGPLSTKSDEAQQQESVRDAPADIRAAVGNGSAQHRTVSSAIGGGSGGLLRAVQLLRNVLLFGDSLTAGAYYRESPTGRLILTAHSWAPRVQEALRHRLCARVVGPVASTHKPPHGVRVQMERASGLRNAPWAATMATCLATAPIHVSSKGYPGKASKALHEKLVKMTARKVADYSLVVIMSGTNDIVGLRGDLMEAARHVEQMHRFAHGAACSGEQPPPVTEDQLSASQTVCGTIALLPLPFNYSLPPAWYGQRTPRGYCGKQPHAVTARRLRLDALMRASAVVGRCAMDWHGAGMAHSLEAGDRALWSDCLHPNALGYDRLGAIVASHLWRVAAGEGGQLCAA